MKTNRKLIDLSAGSGFVLLLECFAYELFGLRAIERHVRSAMKRSFIEPYFCKHRSSDLNVALLSRMRRAGKSDLFFIKPEGIGRAACDKRDRLKKFACRAEKRNG